MNQLRLQPKSFRLLRDRLASLSVLLLLHGVGSSAEHERDCDKDTLAAILLSLETGSASYPDDISNTSTARGEARSCSFSALSGFDIMIIICNYLLLGHLLGYINRGKRSPLSPPCSRACTSFMLHPSWMNWLVDKSLC